MPKHSHAEKRVHMTTAPLDTSPPPPPRWAVRAAHATALVTLPSGIWRLLLAAGVTAGYTELDTRRWASPAGVRCTWLDSP